MTTSVRACPAFPQAHEVFRDVVSRCGFDDHREYGTRLPDLLRSIADENQSAYARLGAALDLAVLGDVRAIPVLRMVFDARFFAVTNSLHEQGLAALGLAVLGDVDSLPRVLRCTRINMSGRLADLARTLLEQMIERNPR